MPSEVVDRELFMRLADKALHCRVIRQGEEVKLKLRTPKRLYTLRMEASQAETVIKGLKCKVFEVNKEKKQAKTDTSPTLREKSE